MIPFFVLMGNVASACGMSRDLYNAANAWVGWMRGGLAHGTVLGCTGFAALSGSSVASALTIGRVAPAGNGALRVRPQAGGGGGRGGRHPRHPDPAIHRLRDLRHPDRGIDRPVVPRRRHPRTSSGVDLPGRDLHPDLVEAGDWTRRAALWLGGEAPRARTRPRDRLHHRGLDRRHLRRRVHPGGSRRRGRGAGDFLRASPRRRFRGRSRATCCSTP